jgi:hypothetical protein
MSQSKNSIQFLRTLEEDMDIHNDDQQRQNFATIALGGGDYSKQWEESNSQIEVCSICNNEFPENCLKIDGEEILCMVCYLNRKRGNDDNTTNN